MGWICRFEVPIHREKSPKKGCTRRAVEDLLGNPFYYGAIRLKAKACAGRTQDEIITGQHEPIIGKKLWDACQKVRGIRASSHQQKNSQVIAKPFMAWLVCGECGHQVTGQAKRKPSGRIYVYDHCAKRGCPERPNYVEQAVLNRALKDAFAPFSKFSPKATTAFLEAMEERLIDLDLYTESKTAELF